MTKTAISKPVVKPVDVHNDKLPPDDQQLKLEYDTLMEEYRRVDGRIIQRLEYDEKSYEMTLLTFGVIVGASSIIVQQQAYSLLLVLAIPFHLLIWAQIKRTVFGIHYSTYIRKTIIPRLNEIVQSRDNHTKIKPHLTYWEEYLDGYYERLTTTSFLGRLPAMGKTIIVILNEL